MYAIDQNAREPCVLPSRCHIVNASTAQPGLSLGLAQGWCDGYCGKAYCGAGAALGALAVLGIPLLQLPAALGILSHALLDVPLHARTYTLSYSLSSLSLCQNRQPLVAYLGVNEVAPLYAGLPIVPLARLLLPLNDFPHRPHRRGCSIIPVSMMTCPRAANRSNCTYPDTDC